MRRTLTVFALAALLLAPGKAFTAHRSITDLVPASTMAVIVMKNPLTLPERLSGFFLDGPEEEAGARTPPADAGNLFALLGLDGIPEGIDPEGQVLVAVPQFPFFLLAASVKDYDLFLRSLAGDDGGGGTGTIPSLIPGIDTVVIGGKPIFARREGAYALLSPMPLLLTPPPPEASLSHLLGPDEKALLDGGDLYLRLDMGLLMTLLEPFLQQGLATLGEKAAGQDPQANPAPGMSNADVGKLLLAETELLMTGLRQVKSVNIAGALGEKGLSIATAYLPHPGTGFEKMLQRLKPDSLELLGLMDDDAAMAGSFHFDYAASGELVTALTEFLFSSGIYGLTEDDRQTWEKLVQDGLSVAGNRTAWYFGPSKGGGPFSSLVINEVKDTDRARALMKESLWVAEKMLSGAAAGDPGLKMEFRESAAEHRGVPIDQFIFTWDLDDSAMKSLFGGDSLSVWTAFFDRYLVASYYTPDPGDLKAMIDRVREKGSGGLLSSAPFLDATAALPDRPTSLTFFSLPRFMELIRDVVRQMDSDGALPPWPVRGEESSGIGIAYSSSGSALKVDTYVPRAEARNIRAVFEYFKALEGMEEDAGKSVPL